MGPSEENNVAPSLLLRGLRPPGRQQPTLPCHPLLCEGDNSPSHSLSRGGSMHQTPRKFGRAQTTDPAEFSWCRAGVSASIETRNSTGRATPSSAALRRQTRASIAVRGGIFVTLTLQGRDRRPNTLLDADALGAGLYGPTRTVQAVARVGICMAVNATTSRSPRSRSRGP